MDILIKYYNQPGHPPHPKESLRARVMPFGDERICVNILRTGDGLMYAVWPTYGAADLDVTQRFALALELAADIIERGGTL